MTIRAFPDGARAEHGETRGPLGAGEIQQAPDRSGGGGLRLRGQRVAGINVLLQPHGFSQTTELAPILIVHHGDLDGIGAYVDDGDGRHV